MGAWIVEIINLRIKQLGKCKQYKEAIKRGNEDHFAGWHGKEQIKIKNKLYLWADFNIIAYIIINQKPYLNIKIMQQQVQALSLGTLSEPLKQKLLYLPSENKCVFELKRLMQNIQSPFISENALYQFHIKKNYLIQCEIGSNLIVGGLKLDFQVIVKIFSSNFLTQNVGISHIGNRPCHFTIKTKVENIHLEEQMNQSKQNQDQFQFRSERRTESFNFLKLLMSKAVILQVEDFRDFYQPIKKVLKEPPKIYEAKEVVTKNLYIIKSHTKEIFNSPTQLNIIRQEALLLLHLDHRNIIKLYNFYISRNSLYQVMQFYQTSLDKIFSSGNIPFWTINQAKSVMQQSLAGLNYLHCQGVFHGHLNADNILLTTQGPTKRVIITGLDHHRVFNNSIQLLGNPEQSHAVQVESSVRKQEWNSAVAQDVLNLSKIFQQILMRVQILYNGEMQHQQQPETTEQVRNKLIEARQLLDHMRHQNQKQRLSTQKALSHPFFTGKSQI